MCIFMRKETIEIYKFSELSNEAKERAIEEFCSGDNYLGNFDEIRGSVESMCEVLGLKLGREYSDLRCDNIDSNTLELSGIRLYKWLMNNYYYDLFKPKYIKCIDGNKRIPGFICKPFVGKERTTTFLYKKFERDNSCVLTGVCYDNNILEPIYSFLSRPTEDTTFEDLVRDMEHAISKTFENEEEWINSDEYISEHLEANEYDFLIDGTKY